MDITVNKRIITSIFDDEKSINEILDFLNQVIEEEIEKENPDCDLIDCCVDTAQEIQNELSTAPLLKLMVSKKQLLNYCKKHSGKNNTLKAVIAAGLVVIIGGATAVSTSPALARSVKSFFESIVSTDDSDEKEDLTEPYLPTDKTTTDGNTTTTQDESEATTRHKIFTTNGSRVTYTAAYQEQREQESRDKSSGTTRSSDGTNDGAVYDDQTTYNEEADLDENAGCNVEYIELIIIRSVFKTEYEVGEAFNPNGLYVKAHYSNGNEVGVSIDDCSVTGFDTSTPGTKSVTVSFKGASKSFNITVRSNETTTAPMDKREVN